MRSDRVTLPRTRADFVSKEHYLSPDIAHLENVRLWPRVWQVACRAEEISNVGDFVTYEAADQSILVVRAAPDVIRAFHNVCPHRGNQLATKGSGSVTKFYCSFHGWQFDLHGRNVHVKDQSDWAGCADMRPEDLGLSEVRVGEWGGFVFINMSPDADPLEEFLAPVPDYLDCIELDRMRYRRRVSVQLQANWKTGIESFFESYHVVATHPQLNAIVDAVPDCHVRGKHGSHGYTRGRPYGAPAVSTGRPVPEDIREGLVKAMGGFDSPDQHNGTVSGRSAIASRRLLNEVPYGTPPLDVHAQAIRFCREAAEADGAGWPEINFDQARDLGVEWNIFPNLSISVGLDAALVIRCRPNSTGVEPCIFDVWFLERYAPGKEPQPAGEFYAAWKDCEDKLPTLVLQDMRNIEKMQRGFHSLGFRGSRPNPLQEIQITHHHQVLEQYLFGPT